MINTQVTLIITRGCSTESLTNSITRMASDTGLGIASDAIRIVVQPNTFVIIGGTALGRYTQRLTVIRGADKWQFTEQNQVLTHDNTTYLTFQPVQEKSAYIFFLQAAESGSDSMDSEYARKFKATKHVVPHFATYYTIHTENGEDNDFRDITLTVALIGASKGSNVPTGVAPIASGSPNAAVSPPQNNSVATKDVESYNNVSVTTPASNSSSSTTGNNSRVPVTTDRSRKDSVATPASNSSTPTSRNNFRTSVRKATGGPNWSTSTTGNNFRASVATEGVNRRKDSVATRGANSFTPSANADGPLDTNTSVVATSLDPVSTDVGGPNQEADSFTSSANTDEPLDTDFSVITTSSDPVSIDVNKAADFEPIPTGSFILRNVHTNCELTAVIDTSPAMMFPTGTVPVEWRTWKIAMDDSGRVFMSNEVKTHRYLQDGGSLVETANPNPVRLIRASAVTQSQVCYYISAEESVTEAIVLSDLSPLGVPGAKVQANGLEIDTPQQLWILVPVL
ncbi:hypothetical protein B0H16DRAFT_156997 [Mycena metata]|uniref:Uncharacterized protein n=1 Tax=Mycena metata TaxID=1033252 RepID=A0AAD7MWL0_9AGAR|nr:hypothetical protein B0H16DRAFT_156997 [Mycena metata]